jgi:hypothetical protein
VFPIRADHEGDPDTDEGDEAEQRGGQERERWRCVMNGLDLNQWDVHYLGGVGCDDKAPQTRTFAARRSAVATAPEASCGYPLLPGNRLCRGSIVYHGGG